MSHAAGRGQRCEECCESGYYDFHRHLEESMIFHIIGPSPFPSSAEEFFEVSKQPRSSAASVVLGRLTFFKREASLQAERSQSSFPSLPPLEGENGGRGGFVVGY